jgi:hypothetical protein
LNIWRRYTRGINELYEIKLSKEKIKVRTYPVYNYLRTRVVTRDKQCDSSVGGHTHLNKVVKLP